MNRWLVNLGVIVALSLPTAASPWTLPEPSAFEEAVTLLVARVMTYRHYEQHPLDDRISERLFTAYLDRLDPQRLYFQQGDLDGWHEQRLGLDEALDRGDVSFAFRCYETLVARMAARQEWVAKALAQPFDFTHDESVPLERSDWPWAANEPALDARWRLQLKDDAILQLIAVSRERDWAAVQLAPTLIDEIKTVYHDAYRAARARNANDVLELYLDAFAQVYDPHSKYMAADTAENFDISMKRSLDGIGAYLKTYGDDLTVVGIVPGGPADIDGRLHAGDRIIAVTEPGGETKSVVGVPMKRAVALIRGPQGSEVALTVLKDEAPEGSGPVTIVLVRDAVKLPGGEARGDLHYLRKDGQPTASPPEPSEPQPAPVLPSVSTTKERKKIPQRRAWDPRRPKITIEGDIRVRPTPVIRPDQPRLRDVLVVELPSFYTDFKAREAGDPDFKSSTRDVLNAIRQRGGQKTSGIILDLRGNHGGSLSEAVALAGLFLTTGPVVQVRSALWQPDIYRDDDGVAVFDGPLMVLVDRRSASASEIVAAALQDHGRAVIVGEGSTYGKGTVQRITPLEEIAENVPAFMERSPGRIQFTYGKFYRINGHATQHHGVIPDLVFPSFRDHEKIGERHVPHALPFDQIEAVAGVVKGPSSGWIPALRKRLEARRTDGSSLVAHVKDVAAYGERRFASTRPLHWQKRKQYVAERRHWADIKKAARGGDWLLDQAMLVMADMIELEKQAKPINEPR